jgi:hypothetical protein
VDYSDWFNAKDWQPNKKDSETWDEYNNRWLDLQKEVTAVIDGDSDISVGIGTCDAWGGSYSSGKCDLSLLPENVEFITGTNMMYLIGVKPQFQRIESGRPVFLLPSARMLGCTINDIWDNACKGKIYGTTQLKLVGLPPEEYCGDGICQSDENYMTCPEDCQSSSLCGNGVCDAQESYYTCPEDCELEPPPSNPTFWDEFVETFLGIIKGFVNWLKSLMGL